MTMSHQLPSALTVSQRVELGDLLTGVQPARLDWDHTTPRAVGLMVLWLQARAPECYPQRRAIKRAGSFIDALALACLRVGGVLR